MRPLIPRLSLSVTIGAVAMLAPGCLETLPEPWLIDDLRVLAVRAEPPEVQPGQSVTLDALVVDPLNRPLTLTWYACIAPDLGTGFFSGASETSTSGGRGTGLSEDPYGDSCILRYEAGERWAVKLGNAPTATLEVPADLFETQDALKEAYGLSEDLVIPDDVEAGFLGIAGLNYRVTLVVEYEGGRVETQKRVNVSLDLGLENNRPNTNPLAPVLHVADKALELEAPSSVEPPPEGRCFSAPVPLATGKTYRVTPTNLAEPLTYLVLLAGTTTGEAFEVLENEEVTFFSFFTTKGRLDKEDTKSTAAPFNDWRLRAEDAGPADFWIVARDGRGGISWCHEPVVIGP